MPHPPVRRSREAALPRVTDVVVVGGDVIGAAVAYAIAEGGAQVLLTEAYALPDADGHATLAAATRPEDSPVPIARIRPGAPGAGPAGGRPGAPPPGDDAPAVVAALARRAEVLYDGLPPAPRHPGRRPRATPRASLHLLPTDDLVDAYTAAIARQRARGQDSMLIRPQDAAVLNPYLATREYAGAALIAPERRHRAATATSDLIAGAAGRGAVVRAHCTVDRIEARASAYAVVTQHGVVHCGAVVVCAGDRSAALVALARAATPASHRGSHRPDGPDGSAPRSAAEVPLTSRRRALGFALPRTTRTSPIPPTLEAGSTFWFANAEPGGLVLGVEHPDVPLRPGDDPRLVAVLRRAAARCSPALARAALSPGWSGMRTVAPDGHPVLGAHPSGVLCATGFGQDATHVAPAVGEVVRDLVEGHTPGIDSTPLGMERFW